MKKREKEVSSLGLSADELIVKLSKRSKKTTKIILVLAVVLCAALPIFHTIFSNRSFMDGESGVENLMALATAPIAATTTKKDVIAIPSGTVKANPFLPYRDIGGNTTVVNDVPKYDLVEPPEMISDGSDAARVMDTIVSGILFDKYSPSAILNIEGNDYLVKKGDVVNNYKVVNIMQDSVTVKLGNNTYKAGIGEILTEGTVNYNDVSNLSKKFGGERR